MELETVGNSGIVVSKLGFGCMSLEGSQKYITNLIRKAVDHGITLFDTADMYDQGQNEVWLGNALAGVRDEVVLATKVGHNWGAEGYTWDPSYDRIIKGVEGSLRRLQTDHIDLYQLHGGTLEDPIDDLIRAMEELKKSGKIREWGISSIRPNVIREYLHRTKPAAIMMQYSLFDRRPEEECLDLLHKNNIGVLARGPIAKGLLAGKAPRAYLDHSDEEIKNYQKILRSLGDPLSIALDYLRENKAVSSSVVGIRTVEQLDQIIHAWDHKPHDSITKKIAGLIPASLYTNHR